MRALVLSLVVLSGCVDFEQLAEDCVARGDCQGGVVAPSLVASSPSNQATDVRVDVSLSLSFSKAMARDSVALAVSPPVALAAGTWSDDDTELIVQPQSALSPATTYTVTASGRSADGAALPSGSSFTFTTQAAPDATAPTLNSTQPSNGAMAVAVSTSVTLVFSEAMSQGSLQLSSVPTASWGTPTWNPDGRTATFAPEPLAELTTFSLSVTATDLAGNALSGITTFLFTTAAAPLPTDTTPPTVLATNPMNGATGVATSLSPTLFFSEPMKRAELLAAVTVTPSGGVVLTTDDSMAPTQVTVTHAAPLASNTPFTISVASSAVDLAGNALAAPFSMSFTTGDTPDTTRPSIVSVTPADGGIGAPLQPTMTMTFSEPMDPAATQAAVVVSMPAGVTGTPTWSNGNTTLTWKVNQLLNDTQEVRWQVGTGARDLSGNTLAQTATYAFRTLRRDIFTLQGPAVTTARSVTKEANGTRTGSSTDFRVGDTAYLGANNFAFRAVLSFDLRTLPSDLKALESVRLRLKPKSIAGDPLGTVRSVVLQAAKRDQPLGFEVVAADLACPDAQCRNSPDVSYFTTQSTTAVEKEIVDWVSSQVSRRDSTLHFRLLLSVDRAMPASYPEFIGAGLSDNFLLSGPADASSEQPRLSIQYLHP